jgi:hypothetical protein
MKRKAKKMTPDPKPRRRWPPIATPQQMAERSGDGFVKWDRLRRESRWFVALAFCGLNVREIARVMDCSLTTVRQNLYLHNFLRYDIVEVPDEIPTNWRELFEENDDNMPAGLREALARRDNKTDTHVKNVDTARSKKRRV